MSHDLRRWLADRLPDNISTGERLVALEIADWAWDSTRIAYGKDLLDTVARRAGLANPKQVGKVLGKLSAHGVELRVPVRGKSGEIVTDSLGRPLFACKGHELTFRIPLAKDCPALKVPQKGELQRSPAWETKEPEGPPLGTQSSPGRGTKVSPAGDPIPQDFLRDSSTLSADAPDLDPPEPPAAEEREIDPIVQKLIKDHGATEAEAVAVVAQVRAEKRIGNLVGWASSAAGALDIKQRLYALQAATRAQPAGSPPRAVVHDTSRRDHECRNCDRPIKPDAPEGLCRECREDPSQIAP